jgi:hypothetical protein
MKSSSIEKCRLGIAPKKELAPLHVQKDGSRAVRDRTPASRWAFLPTTYSPAETSSACHPITSDLANRVPGGMP